MRSLTIALIALLAIVSNAYAGLIERALPNEARPGQELWVTITGQGTTFGQGSGTTALLRIPETGATLAPAEMQVVAPTTVHLWLEIPADQELGDYDIVITEDAPGGGTTWTLTDGFFIGYPFDCGDIDRGGVIDIDDLKAMIAYVYFDFPDPIPPERGDLNCDRKINITDISLMVRYLFRGGGHPCSTCP